ncbi:MAG TPA: HAD family hydrolase [Lysobacter sp.]|nr:HAD family hydrolase [Lysobacter sp.]
MTDPLSSWNPGACKSAIIDFVERVTHEGGADFVPPAERIAVFDNDGTLWCEYPLQVQIFFTLAEVKRLTAQNPALLEKPAYKALVEGDLKTLMSLPKKEVLEPGMAVHAGMTVEEFQQTVADWAQGAKHPKLDRLFASNIYLPQRELLDYLRANGFKTFIVTGGGGEFVRALSERLYGIPPEQVVGSSTKARFEIDGAHSAIRKLHELGSFDDRDEKPVNIALHIGRRPIFAFGNSDGDLAMLRYTLTGKGPRMAWYLHHDDAEREFAYDRDFKLSPLREGLDHASEYGIGLVSMKNDWSRVFAR